jgi:ribosomal protein L11 methyltransferase
LTPPDKDGYNDAMSYYELTIKISSPFRDNLIQKLTVASCLGAIEQDESIIAYFPETIDIKTITNEISLFKALLDKSGQRIDITFTHRLIPHEDWNETWKKGFHSIDIGERFTILPPWEQEKKGRINLVIDPAMAFGTGHHETTRSCLVLLEKYADKTGKDTFLDLGTGTGLLAIAAAKLGYRHVLGIDIDPLAVEAAKQNIEINHVPEIEIQNGSISECKETYDVIAANLISGVLVQLASLFPSRMKQGCIAFFSGILTGQEEEVIEAMKDEGLKIIEKYPDGKWVSLVVQKGMV